MREIKSDKVYEDGIDVEALEKKVKELVAKALTEDKTVSKIIKDYIMETLKEKKLIGVSD